MLTIITTTIIKDHDFYDDTYLEMIDTLKKVHRPLQNVIFFTCCNEIIFPYITNLPLTFYLFVSMNLWKHTTE